MTSKICPSCKEKNNPSFNVCWKCGIDFAADKMPAQQSQKTNEGDKSPKKPLNYLWFLGGAFLIHCVLKATQYATLGAVKIDFMPATFGLLMMSLLNGTIAWVIYLVIKEVSNRKKSSQL